MHAVERCHGKPFQMEFSFLLTNTDNPTVKMIVRDNGKPYDLLAIVNDGKYSLREFVIDSVTKDFYSRKYLSAGDENKLVFEI